MTVGQLQVAFFGSLGVVVVFLVAAVVTAKQHRVRGHLATVGAMLVALVVTLGLAEALGARYDFEPFPKQVHLPIAYLTAGFLLLPLGAGFWHWRTGTPRSLQVHKVLVGLWGVLVLAALGTGLWMFQHGTLKAEPAATEAPRSE